MAEWGRKLTRIEFVLAKTAEGSKVRSVGEESC